MTKYKKTFTISMVFVMILLGCFNFTFVGATTIEGAGATFNLDYANPVGYGAIVPGVNYWGTLRIDGTNQGTFKVMDWTGAQQAIETTDGIAGTDISDYYPWYYNAPHYLINSVDPVNTNDFIDPAVAVHWLNVSANNAEVWPPSSFIANGIYNAYSMTESTPIAVPLTDAIPIQVEIVISSTGPKVLKFDWILDDFTDDPLDVLALFAPSGKMVQVVGGETQFMTWMGGDDNFFYLQFVAAETGTHRLLVDATWTSNQAYMHLEFLNSPVSILAHDAMTFIGNADYIPTWLDSVIVQWTTRWGAISGTKGDKFYIDIGYDYFDAAGPTITAWLPTRYGYVAWPGIHGLSPMEMDLVFPVTGTAYFSFSETIPSEVYRAGIYVSTIPITSYAIGSDATISVHRAERKAIQFFVPQDSFVRFNFTSGGAGAPYTPLDYQMAAGMNYYGFMYDDSNKRSGIFPVEEVEVKTGASGTVYYYYYMPAGTYEFIVKNDPANDEDDGFFKISSEYISQASSAIPVNDLSYPDVHPTQFATLQFQADDFEEELKKGQWATITVPESGQFRLNTTLYASDNSVAEILTAIPSVVLLYNGSDYIDVTTEASALDGNAFNSTEETNNFLYIAYTEKWHDMHFNLTVGGGGTGGVDNEVDVWNGVTQLWDRVEQISDTTSEFDFNGTWVLDRDDTPEAGDTISDYREWIQGCNFDVAGIDESDYYWLRFDCDNDFTTVPEIDFIQLSNITLVGDVNFLLLKDSEYVYCDFWEVGDQPTPLTNLRCSQSPGDLYDTEESWFLESSIPYTIGLEAGTYKLLIVPEHWSTAGAVTIQFAAINLWDFNYQESYAITTEPTLHPWNFTHIENWTSYTYDVESTFNATLYDPTDTSTYYYVVDVTCTQYGWTQLVTYVENATINTCYILQDVPWITNSGPNPSEMTTLAGVGNCTNVEFGALADSFTLVIRYTPDDALNDPVLFKLGLTQYDTELISLGVSAGAAGPGIPVVAIAIGVTVGIIVVAGAGGVIYVLYKKRTG